MHLLLQGKCLDKLKKYTEAASVYEECFKQAQPTNSSEILASIEYRLGCSRIRASQDQVQQGIQNLRDAFLKLPTNHEIKMKLCQALFNEGQKNDTELLQLLQSTQSDTELLLKAKVM